MSLDKPIKKRKSGGKSKSKRRKFVIQEHLATNRHWDLRLQIDGEMWSWAIPKGPSLNSSTKRLAIETEPHKLSYSNFEGVIEEGLYGAGKVIQWDTGTFTTEGDLRDSIRKGVIDFELKGKKLRGKWALVRTRNQWLLVKQKDKYARKDCNIIKEKSKSVKSGKRVEDVTKKDGCISMKKNLGW